MLDQMLTRRLILFFIVLCVLSSAASENIILGKRFHRIRRSIPLPEYHLRLPPNIKAEVPMLGVLPGLENGYSFCGENTRLAERLQLGYRGVNTLDRACLQHDVAYGQSNDENVRKQADVVLFQTATMIAQSPKFPVYERNHAVVIANSLAAKMQSCNSDNG